MTQEGFKRKLTAILSADVVGYSRLMGDDEEATVRTLTSYREVLSTLIQQHNGKVLDSPGDNLLAEFVSVVDAVQCAVAVQNEIQAQNAELPDNRKMKFRIGVNLGDVIDEEDRIYGDGVNIAARLEAMADPGGICVSKTAFDQIETKLPLGYEYLGEQSVKNIPKPVKAYCVLMKADAAGKVIGEKRFLGRYSRKTAMAVIVILVMVAGGLMSWNIYLHQSKKIEPASLDKMAYPLPEKPSIAVLPFDNMSGDPKQEYLCDGITDSIIMAVSKIHNMFVIARNSTFTYKGKAVKVQQVAQELGVQYVLEGSVQGSGGRLRITAQLIDALNGRHIWSERYDRELTDLFAMQDDITMEILTAIRVKLTEGEQVLRAKRPHNIEAALKLYEAWDYGLRFTPEANAKAKNLAEEIIAMEPDWGEGYYLLACAHMMDIFFGTTKSSEESFARAIEYSEKAVSLDDSLVQALGILAYLYAMRRDHDKAIAIGEEAIAKDPNGADAHAWLGNCLKFADRPREAIPIYRKAMRLNPFAPAWYYINLGQSYKMLGRYEDAIEQYRKSLALSPNSTPTYLSLCDTYMKMGKEDEARAAAAEVMRINPKFSLDRHAKTLQAYKNQDYIRQLLESLRKAGLPD